MTRGRARFCVPFYIFNLIMMLLYTGVVANAKAELKRPDINTQEPVSITVDLQDDSASRFMGISLYRIASVVDNEFVYDEKYSGLELTEYKRLPRMADKMDMAIELLDYIDEMNIKPTATMSLRHGTGTVSGLEPGVYIAVQNEEDFNASLSKILLVDAPTWSADNEEYMYDIQLFPKWEKEVWFSFRPEVIYPALKVAALIICLALCLFGPRIIHSVIYCVVALLGGLVGMQIGQSLNCSYHMLMILFMSSAFIALILFMLVFQAEDNVAKKNRFAEYLQKKQFWIVPVTGAALFAAATYFWFVHTEWVAVTVFAALAILGTYLQYLKKNEQIIFHTYDDLIEMKLEK